MITTTYICDSCKTKSKEKLPQIIMPYPYFLGGALGNTIEIHICKSCLSNIMEDYFSGLQR